MIRFSLSRVPGGPRYSTADRAAARLLEAAGAASTLSDEAVAAMTDPDGIRVVADVLFEVESNRMGRPTTVAYHEDGVAASVVSGALPSLTTGRRCSTADDPAVVLPDAPGVERSILVTWPDRRPVSLVEVHSDSTTGRVLAASVWTVGEDGTTETLRGSAVDVGGRLAVQLDPGYAAIPAWGVRVVIDDADPGLGLTEIDPMLVRDVSDDVDVIEVEWARESDPGSAADPIGNYEASEVSLQVDDTAGRWNPATNGSLDVGHRIEVAFGVEYADPVTGNPVEEVLPAGVFYSEPFDTASDSTTVTINGTDRLGRDGGVALAEPVAVDETVVTVVTSLARTYLDLDVDQVAVDDTVGQLVFPYLYPSGDLGSYLADIAKATGATVHIDALDRLVLARRAGYSADVVATITDDTSMISFRRPPGYDVTTSAVSVTASPLALDPVADLWAMPSGGIAVAQGATYSLLADYSNPPAVNQYVDGVAADGAYTIVGSDFYADRAEVRIRNDEPRELIVADLRVKGNPLVGSPLTARAVHQPSVDRYGPRQLDVDAPLVQTQTQVELLADVLLDAFRSLDDAGFRRLPDVSFDALGLIHVEAGDRVILSSPAKGLGGDYTIVSRRLAFEDGALLLSDVRVRETPIGIEYLTLDRGQLLDDGVVVGY